MSTTRFEPQSFIIEPQLVETDRTVMLKHAITPIELERLKSIIGVWEEGRDYNPAFEGHGTGLRPPTVEEWEDIAQQAYVFDSPMPSPTAEQTPPSVDHTTGPWFPPIGNQDGEGSCVAWAVGYYTKTFQEAKEHSWNLSSAMWEGGYRGHPSPKYQDRIFSPDFIYHQINRGTDGGAVFSDAINLVCSIGACSWLNMPYDPDDSTSWPSEDAWKEAALFRGNETGMIYMWTDTEQGVQDLKDYLASGNLAIIAVDADQYSDLTANDVWTTDNYVSPSTNHANTIVGYNDDLAFSEGGETHYGAFKIANSWGKGGWENTVDGCLWISYEAMKQRVQRCMTFLDIVDYEPDLVASFKMEHAKRGECRIVVGIGQKEAPIKTKSFNNWVFGGGDHPFCPNNIFLDITEFKNTVPTVINQSFFLRVYDTGSSETGTIEDFAVEHVECQDTPVNTVNSNYVYAELTLNTLETLWTDETLVASDNDFIDDEISLTTDSNGSPYIAYTDWHPPSNRQAVFVRHSIDGGLTWPLITVGYDPQHDWAHPSITVDPHTNDVFIAVEQELIPNDHDILLMQYVNGSWSTTPVAATVGSDDRFPSITSEYTYGSENRLYISYEQVNTYDDRDLMLARSTDHGENWTNTKLHGDWPDYNVHAQTCITNAEGYVYIAYKWGADYHSTSEIRVDVSPDRGDTWTQYTDVDGSPENCSDPSIVASHDNSLVLVAFQETLSEADHDIRYSYSHDRGSTWHKGHPLFNTPEDEKQPALAVDAAGTTAADIGGSIHAVCQAGNYVKHRKTNSDSPNIWTPRMIISEIWTGKGLSITTHLEDSWFSPSIAWTDYRTRRIYYSTQQANPSPSTFTTVRGMDDRIYYRTYNSSTDTWTSWNMIPFGATCDSPAAASYLGTLYTVVRGTDGRSLWFGQTNLTDNSFSGWTMLTGATESAPTLVRHFTRLILVVRGLDNRIYYGRYDCITGEWETWSSLQEGATCDSPAAATMSNRLHIVVRGHSAAVADVNNTMWHGYLDLSTEDFSGWTLLSGSTPSQPALTASNTPEQLHLIVRGLNNLIYHNTMNETGWRGWSQIEGATVDGPAATTTGNKLQLVVRGSDSTSLWYGYIDPDAGEFVGWIHHTGSTDSAPTLAKAETLLFEEDFQNISDWTISSGSWELEDGHLEGQASEEGLIYADFLDLTDYVITTRVRILPDSTWREAALTTRLSDSGNYYWLGLGCWRHRVSISKMADYAAGEMLSDGVEDDVLTETWYDLRVACVGSELRLYVDSMLELEIEDSESPLYNGSIGIRLYNSHIEIDHVEVTD